MPKDTALRLPPHSEMHKKTYGMVPSLCVLCQEGDPCYVVEMDDGAQWLLHERHLEAEDAAD